MGCCMARKLVKPIDAEGRDRIKAILDYHFGQNTDRNDMQDVQMPWMQEPTHKSDNEAQQLFERDLEEVSMGRRPLWALDHEGRLASLILYGSLATMMYRDTPKQYEFDGKARLIVEAILREGQYHNYKRYEKLTILNVINSSENLQLVI